MFTDTWEPQINGVVTSLRGLTSALRELDHQVTIIAPQIPGQPVEPGVIRIRSLPYRPQPEHRMALPPGPRKLLQLRALDLDIIHTHGIFLPTMALGVARAFNLPLVHTYHTRMRDYVHHYPVTRAHGGEFPEAFVVAWTVGPSPSLAVSTSGTPTIARRSSRQHIRWRANCNAWA
jgi:glycosyltransferase involved in cell wall biosynthesis